MKFTSILFTAALLCTSCASQKTKTAVETVQDTKQTVDTTNEYINRAETSLTEFQKSLDDMRSDAAKSDKMRGKAKYTAALTKIEGRLREARLDLERLKSANTGSWEVYKSRLDSANDDMTSSFKELNAE